MFCKLFETEKLGQIMVKIDTDDDNNPEVRFYFQPEELGVCSLALTFSDEDEDIAWKKADYAFNNIDEDIAWKKADYAFNNIDEDIAWKKADYAFNNIDEDIAWKKADYAFNNIDEDRAISIVYEAMKPLGLCDGSN